MTTVAKKTDEATLLSQLKHIDHNAQVKFDKLDAQKADIERKRVELASERASIPPAREKYHHRAQVAQDELTQLKVQLAKLVHYYELAKGTLEEQAAAEDVARVQKQVDEAEETLARIQKEADDAELSFDSREQEIDTTIQALDVQYREIDIERRSVSDIKHEKRDELCEVLFTLLTGPYLKSRERLEALQHELVSIQNDYRAECVAKLAGWDMLKERLRETILPNSPTYRVLAAELAYLEALVAEKDHLTEPINLPAASTFVTGPRTKAELFAVPEQEVAHTLRHFTEDTKKRITLLKQLIGELNRF